MRFDLFHGLRCGVLGVRQVGGLVHLVGDRGVQHTLLENSVSHRVHAINDVVHSLGHALEALQVHPGGVHADFIRQLLDGRRVQRRREEAHLESVLTGASAGTVTKDLHDRGQVVGAEQLVGLVQHEETDLRQVQRARFEHGLHLAHSAHHDVHALLQQLLLFAAGLVSDEQRRHQNGFRDVAGEVCDGLEHLLGQVARGLDDDRQGLSAASHHESLLGIRVEQIGGIRG